MNISEERTVNKQREEGLLVNLLIEELTKII